jgi:PAS domain S-box-containing protein
MFETIAQMAWTVDTDGEGTFYNKSWYDYTGLDFEGSKGPGWRDIFHPDDLPARSGRFKEMEAELSKGGGVENRLRRADGQYRWHLTRMLPLKNDHGGTEMWIASATEIHELKELQQQKDDFISIASHELKTPVTTLNASLQLLDRIKNSPANEMLPKLISQSRKSMQKISTLIDDLLSVSRFQQGQLQLNKGWFGLSELINGCCNPVSIGGKNKIEITGDKELEIYADEHRIEQVLINFINNAVKYAPGSAIVIAIEPEQDKVRVSVSDSGPGIAVEKLPQLFDRYYRVDPSGYQNSGLGLGLYICAGIIKQHGGQIGANSAIGQGSTFWFAIPVDGR